MKILFATSELAPWVKTGGLADVSAALPPALRALGADVRILVPYYPALRSAFPDAPIVLELPNSIGAFPGAALRQAVTPAGTPLYLLDCMACYARPGNPYLGADGRDWHDNAVRFGLLSFVAALLACTGSPLDWRPDVLHGNDWQTALAPVYLNYVLQPAARTVLTIHNLAFQGLFGAHCLRDLGLPQGAWAMNGVEYYGHLSFLKGGVQHADHITTVSPTYAREIQTDAEGMGMSGLLRYRGASLSGILNGIDTAQWDTARDPHLPAPYTMDTLADKVINKLALQQEMNLKQDKDVPLFGVVSRLSGQKGLDLVLSAAVGILDLPAQLVVLGNGETALEAGFRHLAKRYPGQAAAYIGFDEGLAHRIEAGADMFLMPSRFEPCGLNQMYSLRYGTPPIVRATGGLADTVIDAEDKEQGNGFVFKKASSVELLNTVKRAVDLWRRPRLWRALQRRAMQADHRWDNSAQEYLDFVSEADCVSAPLILLAAVASNGVIGGDNKLLWRLPEDMKRFKALTIGHPVIMGRKTWESLPEKFRPLPDRRNIVLSRNVAYVAPGAEVFDSLGEAIATCADATKIFVIGGAEIYAQALQDASCLEMTELKQTFVGDAYFPPYNADEWQEASRSSHQHESIAFDFVTYERKA